MVEIKNPHRINDEGLEGERLIFYFESMLGELIKINNTLNKNTIVHKVPIQLKLLSSWILPSSKQNPRNKSKRELKNKVTPTLNIL